MTDEDRRGRPEPAVTVADDGARRISWRMVGSDGVTWTVKHDHPDALRHHYAPLGVDEDVPLYRGTFCLDDDVRPFEGDVRFRWLPTPHVEARGSRESTSEDLHRFLDAEPGGDLRLGERRGRDREVEQSAPSGLAQAHGLQTLVQF